MFNQIFKLPSTINRYLNAPLLKERLRYLTYRAEQCEGDRDRNGGRAKLALPPFRSCPLHLIILNQ